jgi:hypothetical protein
MPKLKKRELLKGMMIKRNDQSLVTFCRWGSGSGQIVAWCVAPNGKLITVSADEIINNNGVQTPEEM